jgi:hypothetical protein
MGSGRVGYEQLGTQSEPIDFLLLMVHWQIMKYCGMNGMKIKEKRRSAIGMYIRSTSDILPKGKDIRNSYILSNWNVMRSIADITELYAISVGMLL